MMRGYRRLKVSGHLDRVAMLKEALTQQRLAIPASQFSRTVLGAALPDAELVVRQYLLLRVGALDFNRALLIASGLPGGKVVYPLPKVWRDTVARHGFDVAGWACALLWQMYVIALLVYGAIKSAEVLIDGLRGRNLWGACTERHAYFVGLTSGNLPRYGASGISHDIVSWYLRWPGRTRDLETIYHSVCDGTSEAVDGLPLRYRRGPLPAMAGGGALFGYLAWTGKAISIAAFDWLRGRWWHALLLNQAARSAQVRMLPAETLARQYLFHNSGWIYRPMWTYEAERAGAEIIFYFYSTNCEGFRKDDGKPAPSYGYPAMNWPVYLVWDKYQADFVRHSAGADANVQNVGSIWFQSSAAGMPKLDRPALAVFDVTPHRASRYRAYALDMEYYVPEVANAFLVDVSEAVRQRHELMLWKRKRNIGSLAHPLYRRVADHLLKGGHVVTIDPEMSAVRVIAASHAVISMPFTSTALIAREMHKPTVYYDPTGLIREDDVAAHGIPVLCGPGELNAWLDTLGTA